MYEEDWLSWTDPRDLLISLESLLWRSNVLQEAVTHRKLRLFAVACCRRVQHRLHDKRTVAAIDAVEYFADSKPRREQQLLRSVRLQLAEPTPWHDAGEQELASVVIVVNARLLASVSSLAGRAVADGVGSDAERRVLAERSEQGLLLRDILGNPYRDIAFAPEWRTSTTVALAEAMYAGRDFGAMPVLADALEEAGCDHADILAHCRGPGPHVRGCWVVDLVLGMS